VRKVDETIKKIVANRPRRFDPKRAFALAFKAEAHFDEIIRIHIDDELGGNTRINPPISEHHTKFG
jgi:hypothetical protein